MFLRIFSAILFIGSLAACKDEPVTAMPKETVPCAFAGAKQFNSKCPFERSTLDGKSVLTVYHPDGGFRRLEILGSGTYYATLDGADEAEGGPNGKEIEILVGDDHYLLPGPVSAAGQAAAAAASTNAPPR